MNKKEKPTLISVALNCGLTPKEVLECIGIDHIKNGYVSNTGRGRCIRKDGTFDYLKMSELVHSKNW